MNTSGDNRYANHHYHPSTVTSNGVLSTLDRKLHKDLIRRIYGSVSQDKDKVYVNVPVLTVNEAQAFYASEEAVFRKALETQEVEEKKESDRKRKASDKIEKEAERERSFKLSLTSDQLTDYEEIKENFIKQIKLLGEQEKDDIVRQLDETVALLKEEQSVKEQAQLERKKEEEELITSYGGLNRYNLTSKSFHAIHPDACRQLFGYESFQIMNTMLGCWFPKLEIEEVPKVGEDPSISEYEKCLITIMKFHRSLPSTILGMFWNRSDTRINEYIDQWAPNLGWAGQQVSLLDMDPDFFDYALPDVYKRKKVSAHVQVDGKIIQTEEPRSSNIMKRMMYSNKTSSTGLLYLDWILPCGLSFFHTPLFLGRLSETSLVQLICDLKKVVIFHQDDTTIPYLPAKKFI
jgi:hypothetical protein